MKPEPSSSPYRCAIYFAPAVGSTWHLRGSQWLGRDAASGAALPQPDVPGLAQARLQQLTAAPRRYGWHATLKAPFTLAPGRSLDDLRQALQALAGQVPRFALPLLEPVLLDGFLALCPASECAALDAIAATCVTQLQPLAAPLDEAELARRRAGGLSAREDALLQRWGYPWVLEAFRFHFSLTGPLEGVGAPERQALLAAAQAQFGPLAPCAFDHLSLFVEPRKGADFQLLEQVELRG